jgi:hypothetical protein
MSEDIEFISNVKALSENGTLAELLRRIDEEAVANWKIATDVAAREECWQTLKAIQRLMTKIRSFNDEDKVRQWMYQKVSRRI